MPSTGTAPRRTRSMWPGYRAPLKYRWERSGWPGPASTTPSSAWALSFVGRRPANESAQADDGVVLAGPGHPLRSHRYFKGARYPGHIDRVLRGAVPVEGILRAPQQLLGYQLVEAGHDDPHPHP